MRARIAIALSALFLLAQPASANSTTAQGAAPSTHAAGQAAEKSWFGKFDLVEKTKGRSVRFFARADGLSLFARGDFKEILLHGYFVKARMSIGYRAISCPGGITGPCGFVNFVSIDQGNNF